MIWLHGIQIVGGGLKSIGIQDGRIATISDCETPPALATPTSSRTGDSTAPIPHFDSRSLGGEGRGDGGRGLEKSSNLHLHAEAPTHSFHFENCLAFPGLINSHDHLPFNLFPRLGNRTYANYVDWGEDIHATNRKEIDAVLSIPKELRVRWGIYKNLLNGVTTVVHHGESLPIADPPLAVLQECHMLHSVKQERHWRLKLNRPFAKPWPYVIHVGEGTDGAARDEINTLIRWNMFKRRLIGIHGVAMTEAQAASFAALIWCPVSNFFLLNKTAEVAKLGKVIPVVFGTDSTLTATWNIWEQLRFARGLSVMSDECLFRAVNQTPTQVWNLADIGELREGFRADIVVANCPKGREGYAAFFDLNPEDIVLVMHRGRVVLCDEARHRQANAAGLVCNLSLANLGNTVKYVAGDLLALITEIKKFAPSVGFPP